MGTHVYGLFGRTRPSPAALIGVAGIIVCAATGVASAGPPVTAQPKMGDPLAGLTATQLVRFDVGKVSFSHVFTEAEGLGPIFNKESCAGCHNNPVGGPGSSTVTRAGRVVKGERFDPLSMLGGSLFQQDAISDACLEVVPPEANVIEFRVTNGMMGYGLVEAISNADLLANEDEFDANADGISGVAHMVTPLEDPALRVGRFGWKAHAATLMTFSAGASLNEIGITNPLKPTDNDPNGINPPALMDCDTVADPEVGMTFLEELTDFQRFLAQPPQTPKSGMTGEAVFTTIGCGNCHVAQFTTADDPLLEDAIRNQVIRPYTDFLLHNMGLAGDPILQGGADEQEVKTAPLWGVRIRDPLWHNATIGGGTFDDRMTAAILLHDSAGAEQGARDSAQAFAALTTADHDAAIAFLNSLGRAEFDTDGDNHIGLDDFHGFGVDLGAFAPCFGPGPYTADDPCAVHDVDQDGDVDLVDLDVMVTVFEDPLEDCNGNLILDLEDIVTGTSADVNSNGVPDSCCPNDINGDGNVNILDLIELLACFGQAATGACGVGQDVNLDGTINVLDLIDMLLDFGPSCP